MCIEGYLERNTPTILIYKDGDIKRQVVTLRELRGQSTTAEGMRSLEGCKPRLVRQQQSADIERVLVEVGAIQSNDHRLIRRNHDKDQSNTSKIRNGVLADNNLDDDDDWD